MHAFPAREQCVMDKSADVVDQLVWLAYFLTVFDHTSTVCVD